MAVYLLSVTKIFKEYHILIKNWSSSRETLILSCVYLKVQIRKNVTRSVALIFLMKLCETCLRKQIKRNLSQTEIDKIKKIHCTTAAKNFFHETKKKLKDKGSSRLEVVCKIAVLKKIAIFERKHQR